MKRGPVFDVGRCRTGCAGSGRCLRAGHGPGPIRSSRLDQVPWHIVRDLLRPGGRHVRAFGSRSDQAHLAFQHVPELGKFVEVPTSHEPADVQQTFVAVRGALDEVIGVLGVDPHAAQFTDPERNVMSADPFLPEEHRTLGFPSDQPGQAGDDRGGNQQPDQGPGHIDAFA